MCLKLATSMVQATTMTLGRSLAVRIHLVAGRTMPHEAEASRCFKIWQREVSVEHQLCKYSDLSSVAATFSPGVSGALPE